MSLGTVQIPLTSTNICLTYLGDEYVSYPSTASSGASFFLLGVDVTANVSGIHFGSFVDNISVVIDPSVYIVDDALNSFYKVTQFNITTTSRPPRV